MQRVPYAFLVVHFTPVRLPRLCNVLYFPMKRTLLLCAPLLAMTGCATLNKAELAELRSRNVPPDLCLRMDHRNDLSQPDIVELSKKRVPDGIIIHYIQLTRAAYYLRTDDVVRLKNAGVSPDVIDYMLRTAELYAVSYARSPLYDPFYFPAYNPPVYIVAQPKNHRH